jgi:ubiquinone/menaquinone biosynthesis C-methylase UbiE
MNSSEFAALLDDPAERRRRYREMLPAFYAIATRPYRKHWDESFHLPPFGNGESLPEAVAAQEQHLARVAGLRTGMHALDVGCGIGGPAMNIAAYSGAHITGINIVAHQVRIASEKAARRGLRRLTEFLEGDMTDLPFPDNHFDVVYSFDAICHAPNKQTVYAEVLRVLKPGGVFLGSDWLCCDGLTDVEYREWIEPVCASSALPSILSMGTVVDLLGGAGFVIDDYGDLSERGDMAPNWARLERTAATIAAPRDEAHETMYQHCMTTARAGRAGKFIIGYWVARP